MQLKYILVHEYTRRMHWYEILNQNLLLCSPSLLLPEDLTECINIDINNLKIKMIAHDPK